MIDWEVRLGRHAIVKPSDALGHIENLDDIEYRIVDICDKKLIDYAKRIK